jgi:hypothetical protein
MTTVEQDRELFDSAEYRVPYPQRDGVEVTKLVEKFTGTLERDRNNADHAERLAKARFGEMRRFTVIASMNGRTTVPNERPSTRSAFEERKYRVHAIITAAKLEADEDIHLVITDNGHTMIAELPSQHCTRGAQFRWQMTVARRLAMTRLQPTDRWTSYQQPVTITGVGFLDRDHGQRGVAPNSVELHPVTGIRWR